MLQIWERPLYESEWRQLLASPTFKHDLINRIEIESLNTKWPGSKRFLLITNWPKRAHEELLSLLPEQLAVAFDISVFGEDGLLPKFDETEGFDLVSIAGVCSLGWGRKLQDGSPMPLGPYADITTIQRIPKPIRIDLTHARVRVMPSETGLVLMIDQFRCGQSRRLENGMYVVEEEVGGGTSIKILAEEALLDTAADLLLLAGQRQATEQHELLPLNRYAAIR